MRTQSTWVSGRVLFKERRTDLRGRLERSPGLYQKPGKKGQQSSGKGGARGEGEGGTWCLTATQNRPAPLWERNSTVEKASFLLQTEDLCMGGYRVGRGCSLRA